MARNRKDNKNDDLKDFDFGNIQIPEFDPAIFDLTNEETPQEENRYTKPKVSDNINTNRK
jgi:hypothetical protein